MKRHQFSTHLITAIITTVFDLLSAFPRIESRYSLYHHVKHDRWNESWDRRGRCCGDTGGSCYSGLGSHLHAKQKSSFNTTARQAASEGHLRNGSVTLSNRVAADLCRPRTSFSLNAVCLFGAHVTAVSRLLFPALPYPEMHFKDSTGKSVTSLHSEFVSISKVPNCSIHASKNLSIDASRKSPLAHDFRPESNWSAAVRPRIHQSEAQGRLQTTAAEPFQ